MKALLEYFRDGDIEDKDIYDAFSVSSCIYYRRIKQSDYPNAEELRLLSARFELSYPDLQIRFGLMSRQDVQSYVESAPFAVTTINSAVSLQSRTKLSELTRRKDAPPL